MSPFLVFILVKEYRQAVRDYDEVLELGASDEAARVAFNDRGLAKASLGQHQAAISDFSKSIALGCESLCGSYDNRADSYMKVPLSRLWLIWFGSLPLLAALIYYPTRFALLIHIKSAKLNRGGK